MLGTGHTGPQVPDPDPDYPRDDPFDADAVRMILSSGMAHGWTRSTLLPHMRAQPKLNGSRIAAAQRLATACGVEIRAHDDGRTLHFFRTDSDAPTPYPTSEAERRRWLRERH